MYPSVVLVGAFSGFGGPAYRNPVHNLGVFRDPGLEAARRGVGV